MRRANWLRVIVIGALALGLSGCFDLTQSMGIGRSGHGFYRVSIAAEGLMGEALKEKPVQMDGLPTPRITIDAGSGRARQTSEVRFKSLADLKLPDELITLKVLSRPFFGLGPTQMRFTRTYLIANAAKEKAGEAGRPDALRDDMLASLFGNHLYVFSVTLPGDVTDAAALHIGRVTVTPKITGDAWHGHTVTWTMPLYVALSEPMLTFEADFSAYGFFGDVTSQPADG